MAEIVTAANALTWPGALAVVGIALGSAVGVCAVCWMLREVFA